MITTAVMRFFLGAVHLILTAIPSIPVPDWLVSDDGAFSLVLGDAGSMSVWFPTGLVLTVATALLTIYGIAFGIKLIRIVASFLTLGGGSAA